MTTESSRREFLRASGLLVGGAIAGGLIAEQSAHAAPQAPAAFGRDGAFASPWDEVPTILARIKPPTFADRTFDVTKYGAVGDDKTDCTAAFNKALLAANHAGGGRVIVPAGIYRTGALRMHSLTELHVSAGATVRFSTDPNKYLPMVWTRWQGIECYNYAPFIYAADSTNIAITGKGTLDGQGDAWRSWGSGGDGWKRLQKMGDDGVPVPDRKMGPSAKLRPNMIQFYRCANILVADIAIVKPPMWTVHPVLSRNVTVRNITINSRNGGGNNDGVDPECSTDVHITGCTFNTGDDCIAIKSGRGVDGRRIGVPSSNIVIEDCTFIFSNRGAICVGSEASGGARMVFAQNCAVNPANAKDSLWYALFVKTSNRRGGVIDGIHLRNITVGDLAKSAVYVTLNYSGSGNTGPIVNPVVQNITVDKMTAKGAPYALDLDGLSASHIKRVAISNSTFTGIETGGNRIRNADQVTFSNVTINGKPV
jgi:polygalacturonase